jgi:hypothetical protein
MAYQRKQLTEAEAAELEALIEAAKVRTLTRDEMVRGYLLQGYDQEWADYLTDNGGFPTE